MPGQAQCIEALGGPCGPSSPGSMELASARARLPAPRSFLPAARPNRNCGHPPPTRPQFPAPSPSLCPHGFGMCITHHTPPNRASWDPAPPPWARGSQSGLAHGCWTCPRVASPASVPHDMLHMYSLPGGDADPGARRENEGWKDWSQLSPGAAAAGKAQHILCPRGKGSCSRKSVR